MADVVPHPRTVEAMVKLREHDVALRALCGEPHYTNNKLYLQIVQRVVQGGDPGATIRAMAINRSVF